MIPDPYDSFAINQDSPCLFTEVSGKRLTWEVTGTCNLGCKHCCISATQHCDITPDLERYRKAVREMIALGVKAIYLSGGEPLLWDGIFDLIFFAKKEGIELVSLATNATLLTEEKILRLKKSGLDKILVSIDHFEKDKHDSFRGVPGSFERTMQALRSLSKNGLFVRVGTVIWSENYQSLEKLVAFLKQNGADEIAFSWLMKVGRAREFSEIFVPNGEYGRVTETLKKLRKKYSSKIKISFHRFNPIHANCSSCQGGKKFLYLNYRGQVGPCSWIAKIFPERYLSKKTIFSSSLTELADTPEMQQFWKDEQKRFALFGSGCPAVCHIENNAFHSKDPLFR